MFAQVKVMSGTAVNVTRIPAAEVSTQAGDLAGLVARCGGQVLQDDGAPGVAD
jgi:hypothetical protein